MPKLEYLLSVALALCMLGALTVWTHASTRNGQHALSCQPGKSLAPVTLKGMSIYPRCPAPITRRG